MKKSFQIALISLVSLGAFGFHTQTTATASEATIAEDKPKTTQEWVDTVYTWNGTVWLAKVTCKPTGKNCPLPDPVLSKSN